MRVYLAGPIFQCEDHECVDWREEAKKRLNGIEVIDPIERDYRGKTDENHEKLVEEDKTSIDASDIVLVNHVKPSVGTAMEVLYAWERNKHVVIVSPNKEISPWLIYHSHEICDSLADAATHIQSLSS